MYKAIRAGLIAGGLVCTGVYAAVSLRATDYQKPLVHFTSGSDAGPAMRTGWQAIRPAATPPAAAESVLVPVIVTSPAGRAPTAQSTSPMTGDRTSLARALQRELKRVGCYDGEINGAWTSSTRSAMNAFTRRVNATLPTQEPDFILLALVKGHQDKACGVPCPIGQGVASDGGCAPNAILANTKKPRSSTGVISAPNLPLPAPITGWSTVTSATPVTLAPPIEGRMGLAGMPAPTDQAAAAIIGSASGPPVPAIAAPKRASAPKRSAFGAGLFKELDRSRN